MKIDYEVNILLEKNKIVKSLKLFKAYQQSFRGMEYLV